MKKICTVIGARPQFIKLSVVSRVLRREFQEVLIHTGQHYDYNMSGVFFQELGIAEPDYNLGISGGSHGQMTGRMLAELENVLQREAPDMLLVFGDTNSTMAAALAAVKLHIPVCHVEAGNRMGSLENPEEVNRIVTDHVSSLCLACTNTALEFLEREGIGERSRLTGDPMYDAFLYYSERVEDQEYMELEDIDGGPVRLPNEFYYMTCHRQENTDTDEKLDQILQAMDALDAPVVYPVHPRNCGRVDRLRLEKGYRNTLLVAPVGYRCSVFLVNRAKKIITDSGGLQREAFFAGRPCVTVFDRAIWPETMVNHCNQLARPNKEDILSKLEAVPFFDFKYRPFGDGHSAEKITEAITNFLA